MYRVVTVLDEKEYTLLDLRLKKYMLINPVLTLCLNRTGSLTFSVPYSHPNLDKIDALRSIIKVYWIKKDKTTHKWTKKWIYSGRPTTSEEDFYRTGKMECEGILAYLIDSRVRPYKFSGAPYDYFNQLRLQHNSQVGPGKQFLEGDVDVVDTDSNNYITRESSDYPNTLDEISDKVVELLGAYISARETDGNLYLDCISSLPHNTQKIQFGKNLLDLIRKKDATTIYTAIIPLGAEEETEDGTSGKRLTIQYYCPDERPEDWEESFTDYCTRTGSEEEGYEYTFLTGDTAPEWVADTYYYGLDFIYDRDLREKYDVIVTSYTWDDVTLQSNLFRKGKQYLATCLLTDSLTVSAADLSLNADDDVEAFTLGWATINSSPHEINTELILSKMKIPLLDPLNAEFTIGSTIKTLAEELNSSRKNFENQIKEVKNVARKAVDNATNLITGAKGGYVIIEKDEETGYPWRFLAMDAPSTADAVNVIQINKNGIGFSNSGIDGPYRNAWTIDGQLVADFITAAKIVAGTIGGWTVTDTWISQMETLNVDGTDYKYHVCLQSVSDELDTLNYLYVRRYLASEDYPTNASGWEYLYSLNKHGNVRCQQLRARKSLQCGQVSITPSAADTPTSIEVKFDEPMWKTPVVVASARTAGPGTYVTGVSTLEETTEGFTLYITRKDTSETTISWIAMAD